MTEAIRHPELERLPRVRHGFFSRCGGVSAGLYASLNCGVGSGDDPARVAANRAEAMRALDLPPHALSSCYQVHGREVVTVEAPVDGADRPKADALVTRRPGLALGILTADCAPILFADAKAGVVGAAHAGWRGALLGVTDAVVAAMERLGARRDRIIAVIGPTIAQASYEVGPEFPAPFLAENPDNVRFFRPSDRDRHHRFDLPGYLRARLQRLGLSLVADLGRDTLAEPELFFSYRRTTLAGEPDYGRQLSAIALAP